MSSLTREGLGSSAQRDRRRRILDATVSLASQGGFDAVQMRAVAEQADVALGTLYRYFPSKIHLLVSALARQFDEVEATLRRKQVPGDSPAARVEHVLTRATRGLQRDPRLAEALTRAFMFADASVASEVHGVDLKVTSMLNRALRGAEFLEGQAPSDEEIVVIRVIRDVWLATLVSWVTGRLTADEVSDQLATAVRLILR